MSKVHEFVVLSSQMVTSSTLVVTLYDKKRRPPFAYEPGQYAAFSFFHKGRPTPARCFSITSSPTEQGYLQFAMHVAGDFTTTAEHTLKEGSRVIVEGPFGSFAFKNERDTSALLLAGDIGIAPFISMMRYAAQLHLPNDIMLMYSCQTQDDIPFLAELTLLTAVNPRLRVVYVIGSGPTDKLAGHTVVRGHIDGPLLDKIASNIYAGRTYFVCGSLGFMTAVSDTLIKNGAPAEKVLTEAFTQGQRGPKSIRHNLPLRVYTLTGLSVTLGAGTLLVSDAVTTTPALTARNASSLAQSNPSQSNSRQDSVDQAINSLQGTNSPSSSTTSTVTVNSGGSSTTPTSSGGSSSGGSSSGSGGTSSGGGSSGTTTPPPAPVAPTVSLSASSTSITSGQSVTLSWSVNASATAPVTCTASGGWSGTKSTSGSAKVSPTSTTTYKLTCSNTAGSKAPSVTVNVAPACVSTPSNPC